MVQNLSWRIPFQEQVKFLKSGTWFQFYKASNKDTFFYSPDSCLHVGIGFGDLSFIAEAFYRKSIRLGILHILGGRVVTKYFFEFVYCGPALHVLFQTYLKPELDLQQVSSLASKSIYLHPRAFSAVGKLKEFQLNPLNKFWLFRTCPDTLRWG